MASTTNLMVFRRFSNLNLFNLLSLQAELVDLEQQLQGRWRLDDDLDGDKTYSRNFKKLRETMVPENEARSGEANDKANDESNDEASDEANSEANDEAKNEANDEASSGEAKDEANSEANDEANSEANDETNGQPNGQPKKEHNNQWKLVLRIRDVLKEYSMRILFQIEATWKLTIQDETLLQVVEISNLSGPDTHSFKALQEWLVGESDGDNFLTGYETRTWAPKDAEEDDKTDFVALVDPGGENDFFQRWISSTPLEWFNKHVVHRKGASDEESGLTNYKDSTLNRISVVVTLFLALGFLMGAICALYFNNNTLQRIGIMAGFTTAFGVALILFTTASRIEIFSSTAA
jgi:hypothetical protein